MWIANAERRRAYRVLRHIKRADAYRCVNEFGAVFLVPADKVAANGYAVLNRKPRYAPRAHKGIS